MMNWTAYWIVYYMVPKYLKGTTETESARLADSATLKADWFQTCLVVHILTYGIFLAILAVLVIGLYLNKTVLGYELKAVGFNRFGAEYAGMPVNRNIVISMMIAGALAGLAGVAQYMGNSTVFK